MHSLLSRATLGAVVLIVLAPRWSKADAQSAPNAPATTNTARQADAGDLTDKAFAAEAAGNYTEAIEFYKQAYQLIEHPDLEYYLGQDYVRVGNFEEAENFFRRYLQHEPNGPGVSEARQFLDSRPAHAPEPASPATGGTRVTTGSDDEHAQREPTPSSRAIGKGNSDISAEDRLSDRDEQMTRAKQIRYMGGALIGVGVVIATFALAYGSEDRSRSVLAASTAAVGLTFGGVAIFAYGETQLRSARRVAWSPVVGSGFAGFALAGSLP